MVDCRNCDHPYCSFVGVVRGGLIECANFLPLHKSQKPMTNADRIRAMSDKELAAFLASKFSDLQSQQLFGESSPPTATQLSALSHTWFVQWMYWLKQPVEEE